MRAAILVRSGDVGLWALAERLAGELGFEPRQTESESVVLPFPHSPIIRSEINKLYCLPDEGRAGFAKTLRRAGAVLLGPSGAWQARGKRAGWRRWRRFGVAAGERTHERKFRRAGFPPDPDRGAESAAATPALDRN